MAALQYIALGLTERAAGREMGLAASTVRWHLARARRILGAHSLAHAVALAVAAGMVWTEAATMEDD